MPKEVTFKLDVSQPSKIFQVLEDPAYQSLQSLRVSMVGKTTPGSIPPDMFSGFWWHLYKND